MDKRIQRSRTNGQYTISRVNITLTNEMLKRVEAQAVAEKRNRSQMIEILVAQALAAIEERHIVGTARPIPHPKRAGGKEVLN